jgi:hypothetical protein
MVYQLCSEITLIAEIGNVTALLLLFVASSTLVRCRCCLNDLIVPA